jgi:transcriptional regulator with XRE-family HTH domain
MTVANQQIFFGRLGRRIRELRRRHGYSQEDMVAYGFSARHWQQIEAGRPITVSTLLRICAVLETSVERLVRGLDRGIYENVSEGDLGPNRTYR